MMERAGRFEAAANAHDQSARALEQEADTLSNRARLLRNQAGFVNVSDRGSILEIVEELTFRAASDRSRAADDRSQSSELRLEAQSLRQRAIALVRGSGGGGWRGKRTNTPIPSEQGLVL